jgi:hypothetical protein
MTLMELMLVMMVIAVLAVVGGTNWWLQLGKAHDSTRKTDLEKLRIAMLNYNGDKTCFPDPSDVVCGSKTLAPYIDEVPCEPIGADYYYERPSCDKFIIFSKLEYANDLAIRDKGCLVGCGPNFAYNYYVQDGMAIYVDFNSVPSGDIASLKPVRPMCGSQVKYCFNNLCASCCPGSEYRCSAAGDWCIPDTSCN